MIKIKIGDIISFRNINVSIDKIIFSSDTLILEGSVVFIPTNIKVEINSRVEIDEDIFKNLERVYTVQSVGGEIAKEESKITFTLALDSKSNKKE